VGNSSVYRDRHAVNCGVLRDPRRSREGTTEVAVNRSLPLLGQQLIEHE
jgi:hypothetical protein